MSTKRHKKGQAPLPPPISALKKVEDCFDGLKERVENYDSSNGIKEFNKIKKTIIKTMIELDDIQTYNDKDDEKISAALGRCQNFLNYLREKAARAEQQNDFQKVTQKHAPTTNKIQTLGSNKFDDITENQNLIFPDDQIHDAPSEAVFISLDIEGKKKKKKQVVIAKVEEQEKYFDDEHIYDSVADDENQSLNAFGDNCKTEKDLREHCAKTNKNVDEDLKKLKHHEDANDEHQQFAENNKKLKNVQQHDKMNKEVLDEEYVNGKNSYLSLQCNNQKVSGEISNTVEQDKINQPNNDATTPVGNKNKKTKPTLNAADVDTIDNAPISNQVRDKINSISKTPTIRAPGHNQIKNTCKRSNNLQNMSEIQEQVNNKRNTAEQKMIQHQTGKIEAPTPGQQHKKPLRPIRRAPPAPNTEEIKKQQALQEISIVKGNLNNIKLKVEQLSSTSSTLERRRVKMQIIKTMIQLDNIEYDEPEVEENIKKSLRACQRYINKLERGCNTDTIPADPTQEESRFAKNGIVVVGNIKMKKHSGLTPELENSKTRAEVTK